MCDIHWLMQRRFSIGSVSEGTDQPTKQGGFPQHQSRAGVCGLYICTCHTALGRHKFHRMKSARFVGLLDQLHHWPVDFCHWPDCIFAVMFQGLAVDCSSSQHMFLDNTPTSEFGLWPHPPEPQPHQIWDCLEMRQHRKGSLLSWKDMYIPVLSIKYQNCASSMVVLSRNS